jgi:preprotein translocase subunit SecA
MHDAIMAMVDDTVNSTVDRVIGDDQNREDWNFREMHDLLCPIIPLEHVTPEESANVRNKNDYKEYLTKKAYELYEAKENEFEVKEQFREIERVALLRTIDRKWMDHIDDMDQLRQGIRLQSYGQKDHVVQYKMLGYDMFDELSLNIQIDTVKMLYRVKVEQKVEREQVAKVTGTNKDESAIKQPKKRAEKKVYPNDPCPCGSGLKYKQCHGKSAI